MMQVPQKTDFTHFTAESQAKLNALSGSTKNQFFENTWHFSSPTRSIFIDFSILTTLQSKYADSIDALNFDLVTVSKILWLDVISPFSLDTYKRRFAGITLFLIALGEKGIAQADQNNLSSLLAFLLTHRLDNGQPIHRNAPISSVSFRAGFAIDIWRRTLNNLGISIVGTGITRSRINKELKALIPKLTNDSLTYADWLKGKSYNSLTLDYGQYYVEHCMTLFKEHIALATAIASTVRESPRFACATELHISTIRQWVVCFLEGVSPSELFQQLKKRGGGFRINILMKAYQLISDHFKTEYRISRFTSFILEEDSIRSLAENLNIPPTQPQLDRLKNIVWHQINKFQDIPYLLETSVPSIDTHNFLSAFEDMKNKSFEEPCNLPGTAEYRAIGLAESRKYDTKKTYSRQIVRLVEHAGLTTFVALTGWRKSEFGFPASAIQRFANEDLLDQYAYPLRYQVDWHVYKTSGMIREKREITFETALIARRLQTLVGATIDDPCLYGYQTGNENKFSSEAMISRAVTGVWPHYLKNYPPFQTLEDLEAWNTLSNFSLLKGKLTENDLIEKKRLLAIRTEENWDALDLGVNLRDAWIRSRQEWPRTEFFLTSPSDTDKMDWLIKYRNRSLRLDWTELLDTYLSSEVREWIDSLTDDDCKSNVVTRTITSDLITDCLYPTAHALRHTWAEAVYRRFDGDVGWMIRSQFKHISRSMWTAYIRDKENRAENLIAKKRVISSLVHNYIKNSGQGYAGQMHTFLRRIIRQTEILAPEDQTQFLNRIATVELTDLKANPWGYCLLKQRTRGKARCAESGEPQQHNASPDLCLRCAHNLMQSKNVEWVLANLPVHLTALRNPSVPNIFKQTSYNFLKVATKHVHDLNPDHEALEELQEAMASYSMRE